MLVDSGREVTFRRHAAARYGGARDVDENVFRLDCDPRQCCCMLLAQERKSLIFKEVVIHVHAADKRGSFEQVGGLTPTRSKPASDLGCDLPERHLAPP